MPRADRVRWRELIPGISVLLAVAIFSFLVFTYARVGALRGDTYFLYAESGEARGVIKGSEVWLDGVRVGVVDLVSLAPIVEDTLERVVLRLEIRSRYRDHIRGDSEVQIRTSGSMIGAPIIHIASGTPATVPLADNDTLPRTRQIDHEALTSELAIAARDVPELLANIRDLNREATITVDRVSALVYGNERTVSLGQVQGQASRFLDRATAGAGTFGMVVRDEQIVARMGRVRARADSVFIAARDSTRLFRQVTSDTVLMAELRDIQNEVTLIRARLDLPAGTAGRILADTAIARQLRQLEAEISATMEDMKRSPGRYISF